MIKLTLKPTEKKYHLFAKPNTAILELYKTRKQIRSDPLQKLEIPKTIKHPFINLKIYSQRTVTI